MSRYDIDVRKVLRTAVWFANATVRSTAQVERRFAQAVRAPAAFMTIPAEHVHAYRGGSAPPGVEPHPHKRGDQGVMGDLLTAAIGFPRLAGPERAALLHRVREKVAAKVHPAPEVIIPKRGPARLGWQTRVDGVEGAMYFAAFVLLSDPRQQRRVGICAFEDCDRFFYAENRGGEQQRHCCPAHSNRDRQRRHRARKASRK